MCDVVLIIRYDVASLLKAYYVGYGEKTTLIRVNLGFELAMVRV